MDFFWGVGGDAWTFVLGLRMSIDAECENATVYSIHPRELLLLFFGGVGVGGGSG